MKNKNFSCGMRHNRRVAGRRIKMFHVKHFGKLLLC